MNPLVIIPCVGIAFSLLGALYYIDLYAEPHLKYDKKERWVLVLCIFAYLVAAMPMWLLPIDVVRLQRSVDGCTKHSSVLYFVWYAVYWTNLVTAYFTNDFARCYVDSGGFSMRRKALLAWREVRDWYGWALAALGVVLLLLVFKVGFNLNTWLLLLDVAMAFANLYAVLWFIYLLAVSIAELPKRLWHMRSPHMQLREHFNSVGAAYNEIQSLQDSYQEELQRLLDTGSRLRANDPPGRMQHNALLQVLDVWQLTDGVVLEAHCTPGLRRSMASLEHRQCFWTKASPQARLITDVLGKGKADELRADLNKLWQWARSVTPASHGERYTGQTREGSTNLDTIEEAGDAAHEARSAQQPATRTSTPAHAPAADAPSIAGEAPAPAPSTADAASTAGDSSALGPTAGDAAPATLRSAAPAPDAIDAAPASAANATGASTERRLTGIAAIDSAVERVSSLFSPDAASASHAGMDTSQGQRPTSKASEPGDGSLASKRGPTKASPAFFKQQDSVVWNLEAQTVNSPVSLPDFEQLHRGLRQVSFKWRRANILYVTAMRRALSLSRTLLRAQLLTAKEVYGRGAPAVWAERERDKLLCIQYTSSGGVAAGPALFRFYQQALIGLRTALFGALAVGFFLLIVFELGTMLFFPLEVPEQDSFEGAVLGDGNQEQQQGSRLEPLKTIIGHLIKPERAGLVGAYLLFFIIGFLLLCCSWALRRAKLELIYGFRMERPGATDAGSLGFHSAMLCRISVMLAYNVDLLLLAPDTDSYLTPQTYFYCLFAKKARLVIAGRDYYMLLCPLLLLTITLASRFDLIPRFLEWLARITHRVNYVQFYLGGGAVLPEEELGAAHTIALCAHSSRFDEEGRHCTAIVVLSSPLRPPWCHSALRVGRSEAGAV